MQRVIWCIQMNDGSQVYEFDKDGTEHSFTKMLERKKDFNVIGLIDTINNLKYVVNLKTGEFILNGLAISLSKNVDGRNFYFTNLPNVDYSDGVIQYKCSEDIPMGGQVKAATYNIGYKIPWGFKYGLRESDGIYSVCMTHVQPMITIDAKTLKVGVSIQMTSKITDKNGNEKNVKL